MMNPYLNSLTATELLTPEEERTADRDTLITSNTRLVVSIAKHYAPHATLEECIAWGNVGLIRAAEGFDPSTGYRFTTYATWWIKQAIRRGLTDETRLVRVPSYIVQAMHIADRNRDENGDLPTVQTLAGKLTKSYGDKEACAARALRACQSHANPISPHQPSNEPTPLEAAIANEGPDVTQYLNMLTERERLIIEHRYGVNGREWLSLKDVGEIVGLTRERVRQIQEAALRKMRKGGVE